MWRHPVVTILMHLIAMVLTLPIRAQQNPFTQEQSAVWSGTIVRKFYRIAFLTYVRL
jgi:hypothetical protein